MGKFIIAIVIGAAAGCGGRAGSDTGAGSGGGANTNSGVGVSSAKDGAGAKSEGDDGGGEGKSGGDDGRGRPLTYTVTDLGSAVPRFIDSKGRVGGLTCQGSTPCKGGIFTARDGWSVAPVPAGAQFVDVTGIDERGDLALDVNYPAPFHGTHVRAFTSPPLQVVPTSQADPQSLSAGSSIKAMNRAGHVVGTFFDSTTIGSFFFDGTVVRITEAADMVNRSHALAINSRDQVVGWVMLGSVQHAFLWERGALRDLGTVAGASTMATAINDHGVVAGWGATSPTSGLSVIFRWDGEMHDLGCPEGTITCEAFGMNERGDIVGEAISSAIDGGGFAFIHRDGAFHRLDDLAQGAGGWRFTNAFSINDAGQIVGLGSLNGDGHAFLLTPR
jgi:probable HAF family extracellular repeat protein